MKDVEPIECNLPELTTCDCELGEGGKKPTLLQRLECKIGGGPCADRCTEPDLIPPTEVDHSKCQHIPQEPVGINKNKCKLCGCIIYSSYEAYCMD